MEPTDRSPDLLWRSRQTDRRAAGEHGETLYQLPFVVSVGEWRVVTLSKKSKMVMSSSTSRTWYGPSLHADHVSTGIRVRRSAAVSPEPRPG